MSSKGSDIMPQGDPKVRAENMRKKLARSGLQESAIDAEIAKIIADDAPVTEADRVGILECNLGIAKGRNHMLAKALQSSLDIMRSYQQMGYGDEVYMWTLGEAIRDAERALALHLETPTPQPRAMGSQAETLDWQDTPIELFEEPTPRGGVIRLEKWPEGYVLWYHGAIVWRSWNVAV